MMSTRCTPFGLFAKCSIGSFRSTNNLILENIVERHSNFDMSLVNFFISYLAELEEIRDVVNYFQNSSLFSK